MSLKNLKERLADPNSGATPQIASPIRAERNAMFSLKVGELKQALEANPDHELAAVFRKAIVGFPDGYDITVHRADIQAFVDNKAVEVQEKYEDDPDFPGEKILVASKVVVDRKKDPPREATPKPQPSTPK